jgi:hypothetical protein
MAKLKVKIIVTLVFVSLPVAGLVLARVSTNKLAPTFQQKDAKQEEPTPIQAVTLTDKQKKHSKLYSGRYKSGAEGTLRERIIAGSQNLEIEITGDSPDTSNNSYQLLKDLARNSDAVVIGKVKNKSSQFTEDGEFIFTDYEITVEEVLKNNNAAPIQNNSDITITRIGGTVQIKGRTARAVDKSFKPLEVGGEHLLFLSFITTTGAYQTNSGQGSFLLRNNQLTNLTKDPLPNGLDNGKDISSFIAEVRSAIAAASEQK